MSSLNVTRQSISLSGELPTLGQQPQVSDKAKQLLGTLSYTGVKSALPLSFSFRSLLSKTGINIGSPANQANSAGTAQKLPPSTASKGIASKPAVDVTKLEGAAGEKVQKKVERYDDLRNAALKILTGGGKGSFDWKPLSSTKGAHSIAQAPAVKTFNDLKTGLETIGFKPGGGSDEGFYHEASGTRLAILCDEKTQEISIFVEGLQSPGSKGFGTRLKEIVADSLGLKSASRDLAIELGKVLKNLPQDAKDNMSIVGHSHGGSIAQSAALVSGINGVCFNSRRVGGKTQEKIGQEAINQNEGKIEHFNKPDFLTKRGGVVSQLVKAGNAVSFGTEYSIPPSKEAKGLVGIHNDTQWPSDLKYTIAESTQKSASTHSTAPLREFSTKNMLIDSVSVQDAMHSSPTSDPLANRPASKKARAMLNLED